MNIKYTSTNQRSDPVSFKDALLFGQAPDKGLFMPDQIPKILKEEIIDMKKRSYSNIAFTVMNKFLKGEIPENELKRIVKEAYNFDVPLEKLVENQYIMRLDRGPTASFKDFAARAMARLISYYLQQEGKELIILVATSGDTGGAIANAFYELPNIKVVILMPKNEISERQRRQMTTLGRNITAILVGGKFDDCQVLVKAVFADPELQFLNLSSANSINFGRLLPQSVYYFYAYARLCRGINDEIIFSVPSGNFGDLMGGLIAKEMGLPIYKFIVAVNENDEFPKFLKTGIYKPIKPSKNCLSSAMNVGNPSNLARIIWLYGGQMDEKSVINKMPDIERMKRDMVSYSITDAETRQMIKLVFERCNKIIEPHGAVGWAALQKYLNGNFAAMEKISVSLETADPAKFPETIIELTGIDPKMPKKMREQMKMKEVALEISNDYGEFKKFLKNKF